MPSKPRYLKWRTGWAGASIPLIGVALRFGMVVVAGVIVGGFVAKPALEPVQLQRRIPKPVPSPASATQALEPLEMAVFVSPNGLKPPMSSRGLVADDLPRLDPRTVCRLIGVEADDSDWAKSLVFPGEWECLSSTESKSSRVPFKRKAEKAAGSDGKAAPLFAMARGVSEEDISYFRLKISGTDATTAEAAAMVLATRMTRVFQEMNWPLSERALLSMRLLHPFESEEGGTKILFLKERLEDWHYNLIVSVPRRNPMTLSGNFRDLVFLSALSKPSVAGNGTSR